MGSTLYPIPYFFPSSQIEVTYFCFRKKRLWLFNVVMYNRIKYYRLSHDIDVVTCDVDRDVSTAHC